MTTTTTTTTTAGPRVDSAVRLVHLTKSYPNGPEQVVALQGVSLAVSPGSFTAIMGPSGSGKSTFLNLAAGLDTPSTGQVFIGNTDITALSPDAVTRFRRRSIGFVFQSYNLVGHLTVGENIQLPLLLDGRRPDERWQQALIESVGLTGMTDRLPSELSGGQAQRVAIARALITRPTVVFADEPTGALDRRTGDQVLDVLRSTAQRFAQTLVLVTHDPHVAAAADEVLFLADGRLAGRLVAPTSSQIAARLVELGR
ncbi:ABC transporter related protein [Xylanimonas cellulosilytica DSM 15894]|uniref:ABC transporter related protein n=1 Tax=Xylanimonas cellulosilytica (strain DSM 15894 / JCM 12276 / CECT 5975 / KCTC 9989 / LMG 20990 / NBRC 107835 / XIL07) TaxID=446471 RepID=D1BXU2_XYLCX|nr:ABC transporter ATP-binding protein [Xylanimonas cellulosilytica]ACZ31733.1 ABC transporter related protein [Xylanimonas cellulosilytica DSM 15894]